VSGKIRSALLLTACTLLLTACLGPKPKVVSYDLREPAQDGDPYVMLVTIHNRSRGAGEISVEVSLRTAGSSTVVATGQDEAQLHGHETVQVAIELHPGAPGPYEAAVDAVYPP
jgi:hypothetical protein